MKSLSPALKGHLYLITLFMALASGTACAQSDAWLEEKTVFCYSKQALATYLQFARYINIDGLNDLVASGECDFVSDGKYVLLDDYKSDEIESVPIIIFSLDDFTLWTARVFLIKGSPESADPDSIKLQLSPKANPDSVH